MRKNLAILYLALACSAACHAKDWHVSETGNDSNDGSSPEKALLTLQKVESKVQPGDNVLIGNGTYTIGQVGDPDDVLTISTSGRADAWITWKARPGHRPVIRPVGWAGILITGSYHVIDGLTITGNNDRTVLLHAQEDAKKKTPGPYFNTNGISIDGRKTPPNAKPHHIVIRNCVLNGLAGAGISAIETDYITIEDNKVFDNAWFMRYGGSGISFLNNWAYDDAPGYHNIVQRNYVWNNKTLVPWEVVAKLSDGNGIILDVSDGDDELGATNPDGHINVKPKEIDPTKIDNKPKRPIWKGRTLVANNVSALNGGSGIHAFRASGVDMINNTSYHNGGIVGYAEIFAAWSRDVKMLNNVIVPRPGGKVTTNNKNSNITWDYNLYPVEQNVLKGQHDIVADPQFISVQMDMSKSDFRLMKGSAGIDTGTAERAPALDILRKARPQGSAIDRGAFEN
jgi:Right handed beta helix region